VAKGSAVLALSILMCFKALPFARSGLAKYLVALKHKPILVKAVTSGFAYLMGDYFS
jgi:hypothetical protein